MICYKDKTFCVSDKCLIKATCADYLTEEIKERSEKAKLPLSCIDFNCEIDSELITVHIPKNRRKKGERDL